MKRIATSIVLRMAIALALSFILVSTQLQVSQANAAVTRSAVELKSQSQFRSEAARYDSAIAAVSGITTMRLETADDLKQAVAIVDRERANLKLFFSKLVVLAASDSTFASSVKKQIPDKQTAERFAKEWKADPRTALRLDGAESVATRLQRSIDANVTILRRAAERLKEAAEKLKRVSQGSQSPDQGPANGFKVVRVGFNAGEPASAINTTTFMLPPLQVAELIAIAVIVTVAAFIVAVLFATFTDLPNAPTTACLIQVDEKLERCLTGARNLPFGLDIAARALCKAEELLGIAGCVAIGAP